MNPGIDQGIALIILAPQTLFAPAMKEVVVYMASGSVSVHRTPRKLRSTDIDGSTPGGICNAVSFFELYYRFMIGTVGNSPPCGINMSYDVGNKWQSTSPGLVRQSQKLDAVFDKKFFADINLTFISAR